MENGVQCAVYNKAKMTFLWVPWFPLGSFGLKCVSLDLEGVSSSSGFNMGKKLISFAGGSLQLLQLKCRKMFEVGVEADNNTPFILLNK